jgi:hypothetical protein
MISISTDIIFEHKIIVLYLSLIPSIFVFIFVPMNIPRIVHSQGHVPDNVPAMAVTLQGDHLAHPSTLQQPLVLQKYDLHIVTEQFSELI